MTSIGYQPLPSGSGLAQSNNHIVLAAKTPKIETNRGTGPTQQGKGLEGRTTEGRD